MNKKPSLFWSAVYIFWPPILRLLEKVKLHKDRQPYLLGHMTAGRTTKELQQHLALQGYESAVLAWKDPGELLSMRKIDKEIFQYHVRLFDDGEIRCHYEFSSEGSPLGHVTESCFEARPEEFKAHLLDFVKSTDP